MARTRATCTCGHALSDHTAEVGIDGRAGCLAALGLARCGCEGTFDDLGHENEAVQYAERINQALRERARVRTYQSDALGAVTIPED